MSYSDKEVLDKIRKGQDDEVLKYLYAKSFPSVKQLVMSNSGDADEAKDIFQDAILVFYRHVKTNKFDESQAVGGFIYTVSRNLWINYYTRIKIKKTELTSQQEEIEYEGNILSELISDEREAQVLQVFTQLGDRCKDLLINTVYHKLSMKEICDKMGFSNENSAKTQHYKCKQRLIDLIGNNSAFKNLLQ
ncbi:MAG TPA: sigma-70 family RNA polymerase sigma factor [Cytophagales bacterium]|nr:sigma-70 family RNA polymerase sigma factor [Cytophagales bacterium]